MGISHILQGTDHQLFLLTLLLPGPILVAGRRWAGAAPRRRAARRIAAITASFTLGHSVTLALGVLGLPVPQQPIEALIAVSILAAAVHAIRPIFPGREARIVAGFGLVHGLAFSVTLSELTSAAVSSP
jgi:hydrogenase/urease accessory protein HupE